MYSIRKRYDKAYIKAWRFVKNNNGRTRQEKHGKTEGKPYDPNHKEHYRSLYPVIYKCDSCNKLILELLTRRIEKTRLYKWNQSNVFNYFKYIIRNKRSLAV